MKEIDFLPQWYKNGARKLSNYRALYVTVICVSLLLVAWSFITGWSVREVRAALNQIQAVYAAGLEASREYIEVKSEMDRLQRQVNLLKRLDSKIAVSGILGELSFLIDNKMVLSKLRIEAEPFIAAEGTAAGPGRQVRVAGVWGGNRSQLVEGDVRFKVVINGLAAEAADVARLARGLEKSPYFCQVIPGVSGNKKSKGYQATEFEISCYVANYIEQR